MAYTHFTRDDRVRLAVLLRAKTERKEIGRILNKNPISIWREIKRNSKNGKYIPSVARKEAKERKTHRNKKIENDEYLKKYILEKLKLYWSPEQIAGRLRRKKIVICHETIYGYIIRHKKLKKYLRCQKGKYRRRHGTVLREKQREYSKKRWIIERPQIINDRARIGDWEGDTIIGGERTKRILTHVERKTGYLLADFLPVVSADIIFEKTTKSFKKLPKQKRLSITYTNGLLRQFFPKRSSFATVTQGDVDRATKLLNHRPRKRLDYLTPFEMFYCSSF